MKKLLLSLLTLLAFAGVASANTATLVTKDLGYENGVETPSIKVNNDITITFDKGTNNNMAKYYNTGTAIRMYSGNILTVTGAEGVTFTSVEFTCGSSNKLPAATVSAGEFNVETQTWTGSANSFTLQTEGTTGHARIESITFTYTGGTGGGTTDPNPNPTPDPEVPEVADLAAFAQIEQGVVTAVKSDAVAVCQLGNNLWIKDNSGWMLVYGSTGQEYVNGDVIPGGYKGKLKIHNNLPELEAPENFKKGGTVTAVQPTEVNTGDADGEPINSYIKMTGCTITGSGRTYKCNDGSGEVTLYTNSSSFTVPTGENLTVYAFVSKYKESIQFTPVEVVNASGRETVATPYFTPAEGLVSAGTKVTIKTATEGATIYYTVDGTNPNAESPVFAEAIEITENVTIKALAVKEGWDDSDIATATYTVPVISDNDATFNFADPAALSVQFAATDWEDDGTTGNQLVNVQDVTFTEKGVSVKAVYTNPEDAGTAARYYRQSSGTYSYRVYKKSSIVFTAPENNPITKVTFDFYNGSTSSKNLTAPTEGTWEAPVWTAPEGGVTEATFVATGTQQIKSIIVTCKDALSGVEGVVVENDNAPVEFFNLQGVRVQNPENGLFIRRQGSKVSKVIIR